MMPGIPDWRRTDRGDALTKLSDRIERVVDAPKNKLFGGRPLTDSAKRKLLEEGIEGSATILEAPGSAAPRARRGCGSGCGWRSRAASRTRSR